MSEASRAIAPASIISTTRLMRYLFLSDKLDLIFSITAGREVNSLIREAMASGDISIDPSSDSALKDNSLYLEIALSILFFEVRYKVIIKPFACNFPAIAFVVSEDGFLDATPSFFPVIVKGTVCEEVASFSSINRRASLSMGWIERSI